MAETAPEVLCRRARRKVAAEVNSFSRHLQLRCLYLLCQLANGEPYDKDANMYAEKRQTRN